MNKKVKSLKQCFCWKSAQCQNV